MYRQGRDTYAYQIQISKWTCTYGFDKNIYCIIREGEVQTGGEKLAKDSAIDLTASWSTRKLQDNNSVSAVIRQQDSEKNSGLCNEYAR